MSSETVMKVEIRIAPSAKRVTLCSMLHTGFINLYIRQDLQDKAKSGIPLRGTRRRRIEFSPFLPGREKDQKILLIL